MKLYLTKKVHQKLRYYTEQCSEEISGLGKITMMDDPVYEKCLLVHDIEIFKQEVSGTHSTIDDDTLAKFLYEKTKAKENLSEYRFWWHSHATMAVFFSGTDTGTIDKSTEFPWLVSLVTNHKGDLKARFDLFDPIRVKIEDLEIEVLEDEDLALKEQCKKDIEEKVSKSNHHYGYNRNDTREVKGWFKRNKKEMRRQQREAEQEDEAPAWWKREPVESSEEVHTVLIGKGKGKYSTRVPLHKDQLPLLDSEISDHRQP